MYKIIYFAPDCTDSAVIKRALTFQSIGMDILSFSFRRNRFNNDYVPEWNNIELGKIADRSLLSRLFILFSILNKFLRERKDLRYSDYYYARNLDMGILAFIARFITLGKAKIIYEVLDIHELMTKKNVKGILLRYIEKYILSKSYKLVVSSQRFMDNYFIPYQNYKGKVFLLENKSFPINGFDYNRVYSANKIMGKPWVIGWFGTLRCKKSLLILQHLAKIFKEEIIIYMRGYPAKIGMDLFLEIIKKHDNIIYDGEYKAPDDLKMLYDKVHFNWCIDLIDINANSDWLLPNRIYEGGLYGVPAIALSSQYIGEYVKKNGFGYVLDDPIEESLINMFNHLNSEDYNSMRDNIANLPDGAFVDTDENIKELFA